MKKGIAIVLILGLLSKHSVTAMAGYNYIRQMGPQALARWAAMRSVVSNTGHRALSTVSNTGKQALNAIPIPTDPQSSVLFRSYSAQPSIISAANATPSASWFKSKFLSPLWGTNKATPNIPPSKSSWSSFLWGNQQKNTAESLWGQAIADSKPFSKWTSNRLTTLRHLANDIPRTPINERPQLITEIQKIRANNMQADAIIKDLLNEADHASLAEKVKLISTAIESSRENSGIAQFFTQDELKDMQNQLASYVKDSKKITDMDLASYALTVGDPLETDLRPLISNRPIASYLPLISRTASFAAGPKRVGYSVVMGPEYRESMGIPDLTTDELETIRAATVNTGSNPVTLYNTNKAVRTILEKSGTDESVLKEILEPQ